jgi:uncharacterized membrane protein YhaH (DUF805 family)
LSIGRGNNRNELDTDAGAQAVPGNRRALSAQGFWAFFGFNFFLMAGVFAVFGSLIAGVAMNPKNGMTPAIGGGFAAIFLLMIPLMVWMYVAFPAMIAVMARRFHDQDRTSWLMLIGIIPYLGFLVLLVFMCIAGTDGPNSYGPDPKAGVDDEVFA